MSFPLISISLRGSDLKLLWHCHSGAIWRVEGMSLICQDLHYGNCNPSEKKNLQACFASSKKQKVQQSLKNNRPNIHISAIQN